MSKDEKEKEEVKDLKKAVDELHRSNDLMQSNFNYIKDDIKNVNTKLETITNILQTQVLHSEKIHNVEERMKEHDSCLTSSATRDESIKHLTKDLDSVKNDLKKVVFVLFAAIVGIVGKLYLNSQSVTQIAATVTSVAP